MKLIIDYTSAVIFTIQIPRGTPPSEILDDVPTLRTKLNTDRYSLSDRGFGDAQTMCARIETIADEKISFKEIERQAKLYGWNMTDVREMAAFLHGVMPGFPNHVPQNLITGFGISPRQNKVLLLTRSGWDHETKLHLGECSAESIASDGLPEVLLIRKYPEEE